MATAADLGISEQEFQDAVNLERVYGLVNALNNRCTRCSEKGITHADKDAFELVCSNCSRGRSRCRRIGDSRFRTYEVDKFEEKFGRTASKGRRNSTPPRGGVKSSHADNHRKGRNSKSNKSKKKARHYASSGSEDSDSVSTTLSGSDSSTNHPRKNKKQSKSSKAKSKKTGTNKAVLGDSWDPQGDPFSQQQQQRPAGMLGIYQQAGMRPQMGQPPYGASSFIQPSPFGNQPMASGAMNFIASNRNMMQAPSNGMMNVMSAMGNMSRTAQPNPAMMLLQMGGVSRNPFATSFGRGPPHRLPLMGGTRLQPPPTAGFGAPRNPGGNQGMMANNPWGGGMGTGPQRSTSPFIAQSGSGIWGLQQQSQNPFQQPSQGMMQQTQQPMIRPQFGMQQRGPLPQQQQQSGMFGAVDSGWW